MRRRLPWVALTGLALLIPWSPAPAAVERGSKLFFWKATSPTTEVYLFGSIHLGKKDFYPLAKEIEGAFDRSKFLVLEADETKYTPEELQTLIMENALYPPTDSLSKHATPETIKALGTLGYPAEAIEKMKPWFLAIMVSAVSIQKLGFTKEFGIDTHFSKEAKEKAKEILELESMGYQIQLLSGFSPELQLKFLESTLDESERTKERMDAMVTAWSKGDSATLEDEMIKKPLAKRPAQTEIFAKMIDERNAGMAKKIGDYLKTKDVHFVVVGAAHLVGEKGVVKLLEKQGIKVEQVEAQ
jgi:uncharacterized protein YbaP (TraB family)